MAGTGRRRIDRSKPWRPRRDGDGVPVEIRRKKLPQAFAAVEIMRVRTEANIGHVACRLSANDI